MHRTQILLDDDQYRRLRQRAQETGASLGELVRRALDHTYGSRGLEDRLTALEESFGAAGPEAFDGLDGQNYVERHRRGLDRRLGEPDHR